MARTYDVIDADGHILEPLDLWDHYIDPAFRDRAPRIALVAMQAPIKPALLDQATDADLAEPSARG